MITFGIDRNGRKAAVLGLFVMPRIVQGRFSATTRVFTASTAVKTLTISANLIQALERITSGRLPNLVKDARGDLGLVLRQETTVMLGDHLRRVLNGVAGLLVGAGLLQDVGC